METGIFKHIRDKYFPYQTNCDENSNKWKIPGLKQTCSLFLVLLIGIGLSLLCFLLELTKPKWMGNFHENPKILAKSEMIQEFELIVTKLEKLQAAMMHHNMEAYSTIVAQSMSILENMKFK